MKIVLILLLLSLSIFCEAQKIQVKKGIVTKDNEALGRLEGEATFANGTDITIKSMTDKPLLRIKSILINYHNVFYANVQYYAIDFLSTNQSAGITIDYPFSSEKRLIEYLYTSIGSDFLNKDGLNIDQINTFLSSKDESKKIHADTVKAFALRNFERERLKTPLINRDMSKPVLLRRIDSRASGSKTQEVFEVYQENALIGKIIRTISSTNIAPGATPTRSASYEVMRKVEPFIVEGKTYEYANIAVVRPSPDFPLDIIAYCERTWAKDLKLSDILASEQQIVAWLIEKGCI